MIFLAHLGLSHVSFRVIKQHALLERFRLCHLHLDDELTFLVVAATDIDDTILFSLCAAGDLFGWPIFDALHMLIVLQRQQGVEQANDEVRMLAEYLLES